MEQPRHYDQHGDRLGLLRHCEAFSTSLLRNTCIITDIAGKVNSPYWSLT
jgi:hypothetical protein